MSNRALLNPTKGKSPAKSKKSNITSHISLASLTSSSVMPVISVILGVILLLKGFTNSRNINSFDSINSARFDIGFLVRAGRYSNRIITNQHFDVWRYANNFKNILKLKNKSNLGLVLGVILLLKGFTNSRNINSFDSMTSPLTTFIAPISIKTS